MRWKLAHEDHAIERASLSFHFKEPMPSKPWHGLVTEASQLFPKKGFLVSSREFTSQLILAGPQTDGSAPNFPYPQPLPEVVGWMFRAVAGVQIREELAIRRNQFVYTTILYDRWSNFKGRIVDLLWWALNQALPLVDVEAVKLEYWDRFNFVGVPSEAAYREILRAESRYIPSFPLDDGELWHSHIGFFTAPGASARRLINLNVDVLDLVSAATQGSSTPSEGSEQPEPQRSVGIYSMAQDTVNAEKIQTSAAIEPILDEMHGVLKGVLADVITDEAARRISLDPEASI